MTKQLPPLHLACMNDDLRPNLKFIQIKNGIAQATNAYIIVKIILNETTQLDEEQIEILNGKYIHMECWKELHKAEQIEFTEEQINCWNKGIKKVYEYGEPNGEFFKIDTIIEDVKNAGESPQRIVGYNPKFISILQKIFDCDTLFFSFSGKKGTIVFPGQDMGMFALLMPIKSEDINRYLFLT